MQEKWEFFLKFCLCVTFAVIVKILRKREAGLAAKTKKFAYAALAAFGAFAWINFGFFHTDGTPLHLWDQYHYFIGSKYYPELGYDGIYVATLAAREEGVPGFEAPARARDIRTNEPRPYADLKPHQAEVRARFSDARWADFKKDVCSFHLKETLFLDHGYNATPVHAAMARLFSSRLPFNSRTAHALMFVDFALLLGAGAAIAWGFGIEALAMASLCFGLGAASRFYWVGGAFLRQDYFAALTLAAAFVARRKYAGAGAALAYSACVRIFPVLFAVPLAAAALFGKPELRAKIDLKRFVLGFALSAAALGAAGTAAGRGPGAYAEFAARIAEHSGTTMANDLGLRTVFLASPSNLRGVGVDPESYYDLPGVDAEARRTAEERGMLPLAGSALAAAAVLLIAAKKSREPEDAFLAGAPLVLGALKLNWYYGSIFSLTTLARPLRDAEAFLWANAATYLAIAAFFVLDRLGFITIYMFIVSLALTLALVAYFAFWFAPRKQPRLPADKEMA